MNMKRKELLMKIGAAAFPIGMMVAPLIFGSVLAGKHPLYFFSCRAWSEKCIAREIAKYKSEPELQPRKGAGERYEQ